MASLASEIVSILTSLVVTLLLFIFCLLGIIPGIHQGVPRSRVKCLMQRYLLFKSISRLIISSAVMFALWLLQVPLVPVFGLITFLLNFIPNTGSLFAMLAPIPFVLLGPETSLVDAVLAFVVPFAIHNSLGCIVDARVLAGGLELHPLTIVFALLFWGSVWGIAGAVLSVPITCCIKLWLEEIDHPYAKRLHIMFERPFDASPLVSRSISVLAPAVGSRGPDAPPSSPVLMESALAAGAHADTWQSAGPSPSGSVQSLAVETV
jgi:predicted PurR-regulated permease PerM